MRYVTIPPAIEGLVLGPNREPMPYTFEAFLVQFVWTHPSWSQDAASVESFVRASDKIARAEDGRAALLDEDYERLQRAALAAHHDGKLPPLMIVPLMRFVQAITGAPSTP